MSDYPGIYEEYRQKLLGISAKLDQMVAEAESILAGPGDAEIGCWAEDLRESIAEMSAMVDDKLRRGKP